jgi:hypothetical protein
LKQGEAELLSSVVEIAPLSRREIFRGCDYDFTTFSSRLEIRLKIAGQIPDDILARCCNERERTSFAVGHGPIHPGVVSTGYRHDWPVRTEQVGSTRLKLVRVEIPVQLVKNFLPQRITSHQTTAIVSRH